MGIPVFTIAEVRAAEAAAVQNGVPYAETMQRAGAAVARRIRRFIEDAPNQAAAQHVTMLIGPGNNGGDGLVAARILKEDTRASIHLYLLRERPNDDHLHAAVEAGLSITVAPADRDSRALARFLSTSIIVVDALYGIGVRLPLPDDAQQLLRKVHAILNSSREGDGWSPIERLTTPPRRPHVLALDCPSGLECDGGAIDEAALMADETITMIGAKTGQFLFPGAAAVGRLDVCSLDLPEVAYRQTSPVELFTSADASRFLPHRPPNSHKGTFGRVLVVGGSRAYTGAPGLAGVAAYRLGVGLVTIAAPVRVIDRLAGTHAECTWLALPDEEGAIAAEAAASVLAEHADALVLGMGMSQTAGTRAFIDAMLGTVGSTDTPLVLDADALTLLAQSDRWHARLPPNTVLTPHPGEMARLCDRPVQEVVANRWALARELAAKWNVVLVLKGAHTLIAAPDSRLRVLPFKTSALAKAGTGDVLAGMIGSLCAQGLGTFDGASVAAYIHGRAGEIAANRLGTERSVCASDVIDGIPRAVSELESA